MPTISRTDVDESMHPLWLGMLMLFAIVLLIGIVCCLRVKCTSALRHRFVARKLEHTSNHRHTTPRSHAYTCPTVSSSPKLYTLVNHVRRKQFAIRQQRVEEEEENPPAVESDPIPQISISPSLDTNRNSEIARKFYASLRNTSQCRNSSSLDSHHSEISNRTNIFSTSVDQVIKPIRQGQMKFFRTPRFFKSIPNQDDMTI